MNLKEAFRFQNKLTSLLDEATVVLTRDRNLLKTETTVFKKRASGGSEEDETCVEPIPNAEFEGRITQLADFAVYLLLEKEGLAGAIRKAKLTLPVDIDNEVSLNSARQGLARIFAHMNDLRSSETTQSGTGVGYRFNAEGNQVSYKCDVKTVRTIDFDRNKIRKYLSKLTTDADARSMDIDKAIVNTLVEYDAPFNVNDSFATVFEGFCGEGKASQQ